MADGFSFESCCTEEKKIGTTAYSNIYNEKLTVGGTPGTWNIERIDIPLSDSARANLSAMFPNTDAYDIKNFCNSFDRFVVNGIHITKRLNALGNKFITKYAATKTETKEDSGEASIYIITEPFSPISDIFKLNDSDGILLSNILVITMHLLNICLSFDLSNINLGVVDLNEVRGVYNNGVVDIRYGNPLFGYDRETDNYFFSPAMPVHTSPKVRAGEKPNILTDIYSVMSITWSLCNGLHYTSKPDFSSIPENIPKDIVELMRYALDTDTLEQESDDMHATAKDIAAKMDYLRKRLKDDPESDPLIHFGSQSDAEDDSEWEIIAPEDVTVVTSKHMENAVFISGSEIEASDKDVKAAESEKRTALRQEKKAAKARAEAERKAAYIELQEETKATKEQARKEKLASKEARKIAKGNIGSKKDNSIEVIQQTSAGTVEQTAVRPDERSKEKSSVGFVLAIAAVLLLIALTVFTVMKLGILDTILNPPEPNISEQEEVPNGDDNNQQIESLPEDNITDEPPLEEIGEPSTEDLNPDNGDGSDLNGEDEQREDEPEITEPEDVQPSNETSSSENANTPSSGNSQEQKPAGANPQPSTPTSNESEVPPDNTEVPGETNAEGESAGNAPEGETTIPENENSGTDEPDNNGATLPSNSDDSREIDTPNENITGVETGGGSTSITIGGGSP